MKKEIITLRNGQRVKASTFINDMANKLQKALPIKKGDKFIDYRKTLNTAFSLGYQRRNSVLDGVKAVEREIKAIQKTYDVLMAKQENRLTWWRKIFVMKHLKKNL